jgi:hypothetical protein
MRNIKAASPLSHCILTVFLAAGCGENDGTRAALVVRDSAGITIVENALPEAVLTYTLAGPSLEIGDVGGAEEYQLHDVSAVVQLSDGSIVIATGGAEIRWYRADGSFRHSAGGEGDGPGELRNVRYMRALAGDSLLVFDGSNRRVTVFAPNGSYARDTTLRGDDARPATLAGASWDGTLLTRTVSEAPSSATALYRPTMEFAVVRDGATKSLRSYRGPEASLHVDGRGGGINSVFISVLPFARAAHAVAAHDRFFIGSSDSFEIDVWDTAGLLVRIIRVVTPQTQVGENLRQAYRDGEVARRRRVAAERMQPFDEGAARQQLESQRFSPAVPAYEKLLATSGGGLWVKEYTIPGTDTASQRWTMIDPTGRLEGIIDLPARFTPMHVEDDVVLGVFRGDLDVPFVRRYTFSAS